MVAAPGTGDRSGSTAVHPLVALVILDGWGHAPSGPGNAVELANTPTFDSLWEQYPHGFMSASGRDVGLPDGQMGNSEVGHLNLGAGRVVFQDLTRIDDAIADRSFMTNPVLLEAIGKVRERQSTLHVIALVSRGGVHSHVSHVEEVVLTAARAGAQRVSVHAITDGRDVAPDASLTDLPQFERFVEKVADDYGVDVHVATVVGRYWAMDRDRRWDRTRRAFDAFTARAGVRAVTAAEAIGESHAVGTTDEFLEPWIITGAQSKGDGRGLRTIEDGDVVLFANFRPDRMRQIVHAFTAAGSFDEFARAKAPAVDVYTMTRYEEGLDVGVLFPPHDVTDTLADVCEELQLAQLHVAETEKYAHVTYFFNGGVERCHELETRALVDSPRDVATYDLKPEMSAVQVADEFCTRVAEPEVRFAIINFANPDMVGHTGVIDAAVRAVETVDAQLARVVDAVRARGGVCLVTADHGNAEQMLTAAGTPHTAHTTNPVPVIVTVAGGAGLDVREGGRLADIAPTVLDLLGIHQPTAMTGTSLLVRDRSAAGVADG